MELLTGVQPMAKDEVEAFDTPVNCIVISYRSRLADADGISAKAAIDGCVHRGILQDDDARWVKEVRHRQIKVKNKEEEKTVLIFIPADK